jgi:hypothetical protein
MGQRCYQSGAVHRHGATVLPERGGASPRGNTAIRAGRCWVLANSGAVSERGDGVGAGRRCRGGAVSGRGGVGAVHRCYQSGATVSGRCLVVLI